MDPLVKEICDLLAKRYGFVDFADVRPLELMQIILADADAITDWYHSKQV